MAEPAWIAAARPTRVAIFWDYENCEIPSNATAFDVTEGILRIAHRYGTVKCFNAYAAIQKQMSSTLMQIRLDLPSCGVSMVDCPNNGGKDVADKMLILEMMSYAWDNPGLATFVLISGDRDFVRVVSTLRFRGHTVIVIGPNDTHITLETQASEVYDWNEVIRPLSPTKAPLEQNDTQYIIHSKISTESVPEISPVGRHFRAGAPEFNARSGLKVLEPRTDTAETLNSRPSGQKATPTGPVKPGAWAEHEGDENVPVSTDASAEYSRKDSYHVTSQPLTADEEGLRISHQLSEPPDVLSPEELSQPQPANSVANNHEDASPSTMSINALSTKATPHSPYPSFARLSPSRDPHFSDSPTPDSNDLANSLSSPSRSSSNTRPSLMPQAAQEQESGIGEPKTATPSTAAVIPVPKTYRIKEPLPHFMPLVKVLEAQRLDGWSRVVSSQLGQRLMKENQRVYKLAGVGKLKDYLLAAEKAGVIVAGGDVLDNGNRWVALHPAYHGEPKPSPTMV